jgi:hypothetical protein
LVIGIKFLSLDLLQNQKKYVILNRLPA